MNANRLIALALGLLTAGVLALGWLLGVAPRLAEAGQANGERALVEAQNAAHEARLAELADKFENIDEMRAELTELHEFIPDEHRLEDFLDSLDAKAATASVVLQSVTMGEALEVIAVDATPASTGPVLITIPVTVQVVGALDAVLAFTDAAQRADRIFVVNSFAWAPDEPGATLTGSLYVIAEPTVEPAS